jgi:hypothetical protein
MAVSEKIRRDTWMQEKSREIKEMTVKGLQPEIERLLTKHKKELQRMEEGNTLELQRQRQVPPSLCRLCPAVFCARLACATRQHTLHAAPMLSR